MSKTVSGAPSRSGLRYQTTWSPSACPSTPKSGERKVCIRPVEVLVTSRADWISSFSRTMTPMPRAAGSAATRTAFTRFSPASVERAEAGRCEPVTTIGTGTLAARWRA